MFSPGKVNSVALSQSFVLVFPYYFGQDFQSCFDPASDKAFIIDSFAEKAQSCFEKRRKGLEVSPSPTLFFSFFFNCFHSDMHSRSSACLWRNCCFNAMVFIHLSLESGSLLLGAAQLIWGLGFFFSTYCLHVIGFLSLLGWCSHLSDTYQSKTSIVFCGTRFYFLLLICYKWIWIACKTKEMRQVIVFFSLSEKDLGDLL